MTASLLQDSFPLLSSPPLSSPLFPSPLLPSALLSSPLISSPLQSKSSSSGNNPLVTVPSALITTDITVTFTFQSFFLVRWQGLRSSLSLRFILNILRGQVELFGGISLLTITRSGRLVEIRRSVCISNSQRSLCVLFSLMDSGLCVCHLFEWSNLNFLHNSQWITMPTQSCLVLYSFCANLLHSLM